MPYMFPRLTDRPHTKISSKTYRQSMPYIYPEAGRERKNEICGAKKSKSLKKSTLRAKKKTIVTGENLDSATGPIKKLDPAKITHSIPDFVSRNQIHTPDIWQDLESTLPISKIKTCRVLNPYFGTSLLFDSLWTFEGRFSRSSSPARATLEIWRCLWEGQGIQGAVGTFL